MCDDDILPVHLGAPPVTYSVGVVHPMANVFHSLRRSGGLDDPDVLTLHRLSSEGTRGGNGDQPQGKRLARRYAGEMFLALQRAYGHQSISQGRGFGRIPPVGVRADQFDSIHTVTC
jgi:hypothetical protein